MRQTRRGGQGRDGRGGQARGGQARGGQAQGGQARGGQAQGGQARGGRGGRGNGARRPPESPEERKARSVYSDWKVLLYRGPSTHSARSGAELERFWTKTREILDSPGCDLHHLLVQDLVAEQDKDGNRLFGLRYVLSTVERGLKDDPARRIQAMQPFLQVLTHPNLLDSLSIDAYVGTLYNFIGGATGQRGVAFLIDVCHELAELCASHGAATKNCKELLRLTVETLHQLLRREHRCRLNEDLPQLCDKLDHLAEITQSADPYGVGLRIQTLRGLMGREARLSEDTADKGDANKNGSSRSTFPLEMPLPGGRHDNDHADIAKIQIFPTVGEIMSNNAEFLPSTDWLEPHFLEDPVQRHLDTHFRLMRHDIFGSLVRLLHDFIAQGCSLPWLRAQKDMRAHGYGQARIQRGLSVDKDHGFEATVLFLPPPDLRKKSKAQQRQWWAASSRLQDGCLVCFVPTQGAERSVLFLNVIGEKKDASNRGKKDTASVLTPDTGLSSIKMRLATKAPADVASLVQHTIDQTEGTLVEFPGIISGTFTPVLKNLQRMIQEAEIPFSKWILPQLSREEARTPIPPPAYARHLGFRFGLNSITKGGSTLQLDPITAVGDRAFLKTLEEKTGLDSGQCQGLVGALTREFSMLQGPPGTGKSYVGVQLARVLLGCKSKTNQIGPIIVICYTNHALDQFLKHLMEVGIEKIIRIGGRCRVPELEGKNLRLISKGIEKTRTEMREVAQAYETLEECELSIAQSLGHLRKLHSSRGQPSWDSLEPFMRQHYAAVAQQLKILKSGDAEGFIMTGKDPLLFWMRGYENCGLAAAPQRCDTELLIQAAQNDIWSLSKMERQRVVNHIIDEAYHYHLDLICARVAQTSSARQKQMNVYRDADRRALGQADVIGLTTTGLAKDIDMIRRLGSKIFICEEAAEVLEAHLISALVPGVEHFIQIGDHLQLRPQISDYSLSLESAKGARYQLNRSQFERRALGEPGLEAITFEQLNIQRRARPELSRLISTTLYPELRDHPDVIGHPDVVGMRDNLFWLEHEHLEDNQGGDVAATSWSNRWEVGCAVSLVRHLVRQGAYSPTDIAVITPYVSQLHRLRKAFGAELEVFVGDRDEEALLLDGHGHDDEQEIAPIEVGGKPLMRKSLNEAIRLATVDNFQGEEAKVVIISLVRGNPENKVGFLRTSNRINVLLSRAQHGLYLIGNSKTYLGSNVPMWIQVHRQLQEADRVGKAFRLCCPRHPETVIQCSTPEDFLLRSPEGGCSLTCERRLDRCGHRCMAKCHSDNMHSAFSCLQECKRIRRTCDHACPKLCGAICGDCMVPIDGVQLPCGHVKHSVPCHKTLKVADLTCSVQVTKTVPGCGHRVTVPCFKDVASKAFFCQTKCKELLHCGHPCPGTCHRCRKQDSEGGAVRYEHVSCEKPCRRPYTTCNHVCNRVCHDGSACASCEERCEVRCPHSKCGKGCKEPCAPCIEPCTWHCEHQGNCAMPCAAPCERLPCDERCTKTLGCGHQCPGVCGEECANGLCHDCGPKGDAIVDYLMFQKYADINPDETPIVVLACGHFLTAESLDGIVGMGDVYLTDKDGKFTALRDISSDMAKSVPGCPECRQPIRQFATKRYNRVVNRAVMDETSKRLLIKGRVELQALEGKAQAIERALAETRTSFCAEPMSIMGSRLKDRYKEANKVIGLSRSLKLQMEAEHQPAKKLCDAIVKAKGKTARQSYTLFIDKDIYFGAMVVDFRLQDLTIRDRIYQYGRDRIPPAVAEQQRIPITKYGMQVLVSCARLVEESRSEGFPRVAVKLTLCHGRIAKALETHCRNRLADPSTQGVPDQVEQARGLLTKALEACSSLQFSGADHLKAELEETLRLYKDRYEAVTAEEIASVKMAMVGAPGGIASNSGHWYKCQKGHPFAIGECGMPMELARCPECGSRIGGQNHTMVEGIERASEMEGDAY